MTVTTSISLINRWAVIYDRFASLRLTATGCLTVKLRRVYVIVAFFNVLLIYIVYQFITIHKNLTFTKFYFLLLFIYFKNLVSIFVLKKLLRTNKGKVVFGSTEKCIFTTIGSRVQTHRALTSGSLCKSASRLALSIVRIGHNSRRVSNSRFLRPRPEIF